MEAPRYEHTCDACSFLGLFDEYDLYFCPQSGIFPTVIARFSSRNGDYLSGLAFADSVPALAHAKSLAVSQGLLAL